MAIGELFSFREWDDTSWSVTAECRGLSAVFFLPLQNDPKHVSAEKHKLEKCATHVQSCSNAETLHDVIVNTDSGAANQKKSVMLLVID